MPSLEDKSNAELLELWRGGHQQAARVLVRRYMARMTALVRSRLSRKLAKRLDAEDVVLSAWRSFFVATGAGAATVPADDDIWPLLVTISLRKMSHQATRHHAHRRDVNAEVNYDAAHAWQGVVAHDPSPIDAALIGDEVEAVMQLLAPSEREVMSRQLRGMDAATIAGELKCSDRTVRRAFQRIRDVIVSHVENDDMPSVVEIVSSPDRAVVANVKENPLPRPTVEFHEYRLEKLIGQGGFGKIYRATRHQDGATVAVKYLKKQFWRDTRAREAFLRETELVSRVSHPGIIRHHGWGISPSGTVFIVMDWIDGCNVRTWRDMASPSYREILECAISVAESLCAVHEKGVIHGDIAPRNVLRRQDGAFVLTDFGFAQSLSSIQIASLGGTPHFLAPEQVSDVFGSVGPRTDVYGLGGLLLWLLTGTPPITGDDIADVLANVISGVSRLPHEALPEYPTTLMSLVQRCLSKELASRPKTMSDVLTELRRM